ncbi:hypothetical protein BGW39_000273 [Mortierella sp. 14UC]|nr:hypothetical protein BGW39_000273 [Mortierella sp. 14UC]
MDPSTVASLPPEVLLVIVPFLDLQRLAAATLVNKEWSAVFNPFLWKSVCWDHNIKVSSYRPRREEIWYLRLKASIESGALVKNGKWIQEIRCRFYGIAKLLLDHGQGCTGLLELSIGSLPDPLLPITATDTEKYIRPEYNAGQGTYLPPVDLNSLTTFLQNTSHLRHLTLQHSILNECSNISALIRLIDAIPQSIEHLELQFWNPRYGGRTFPYIYPVGGQVLDFNDEYLQDALHNAVHSPLLNLKCLSFSYYAVDENRRTLHRLLSRCEHLETIFLKAVDVRTSPSFLMSLLPKFCPKVANLHVLDWDDLYSDELIKIFKASPAGWKTLGLPQRYDEQFGFDDDVAEALLENSSTLENLRLDGIYSLPSSAVQRLLSSAPNLKRLDVMSRNQALEGNFELSADDIISGQPWVCTKLESLKVQIVGVPRPDVLERNNGIPLYGPLHEGTLEASRQIQHGIYEQLGRLTHLKQLVLGNDEIETGNGGYEQEEEVEEDDKLRLYREEVAREGWRQYDCLEMTVESGMDAMAGLQELQVLELGAMQVGMIDQEWAKENWPRLGSTYKDTFWTDHGHKEHK